MYNLIQGDCLGQMDNLINHGIMVDMILTDPPYGTTACKWDSIIPFEPMWERINKLIKPNGCVALFGSEPFSSALRMSNKGNYRYDWYWVKTKPSLYQHAKNRPMKAVETISIFSKCSWGHESQLKENRMLYFPQGVISSGKKTVTKNYNAGRTVGERPNQIGKEYESFTGFPNDVLYYQNVTGKKCIHPTQKPIELLEYLIKTYTMEESSILDFTMGSGSTGVACTNTNRNFIGVELDQKYYNVAKSRLEEAEKNDKMRILS